MLGNSIKSEQCSRKQQICAPSTNGWTWEQNEDCLVNRDDSGHVSIFQAEQIGCN